MPDKVVLEAAALRRRLFRAVSTSYQIAYRGHTGTRRTPYFCGRLYLARVGVTL